MKKFVAILLTILLLSSAMAVPVMATETTEEVVAVYEDGSYIVREHTEVILSGARASTISKSASCSYTCYSGDDVRQWDYTLYGTFLYRYGISAQAQNRSDAYNIYKSDWSLKSHDTWVDADSVFGTVSMKRTAILITVATISTELSMTCDAYGNITYEHS